MGRDLSKDIVKYNGNIISTHTPAWGATHYDAGQKNGRKHFNSHARVGRDAVRDSKNAQVNNFNSHARVGRDVIMDKTPTETKKHFNSHARVGRDFGKKTRREIKL